MTLPARRFRRLHERYHSPQFYVALDSSYHMARTAPSCQVPSSPRNLAATSSLPRSLHRPGLTQPGFTSTRARRTRPLAAQQMQHKPAGEFARFACDRRLSAGLSLRLTGEPRPARALPPCPLQSIGPPVAPSLRLSTARPGQRCGALRKCEIGIRAPATGGSALLPYSLSAGLA